MRYPSFFKRSGDDKDVFVKVDCDRAKDEVFGITSDGRPYPPLKAVEGAPISEEEFHKQLATNNGSVNKKSQIKQRYPQEVYDQSQKDLEEQERNRTPEERERERKWLEDNGFWDK